MRDLGVRSDTPILVAVSGGMDSMVLLHLAQESGFKIAAAHVNFKLRGDDSDGDQEFVKSACAKLGIPFYTNILKVDKTRDNVQIVARDLRYAWFKSLCESHGFEFILTAHHQDDRIETFFINLHRGSGIKGLRSIPEKNENVLRPILDFSKRDLLAYAEENGITWREDASNKETDYLRNKIRHGIAKDFSELSDAANANLAKSIDFLAEANHYFDNTSAVFIHSLINKNGIYFIPDEKWNYLFGAKPLHKYVLEYFGFHADQFDALGKFGESQSGKQMEGEKYTIYRDRNQFVLEPKEPLFDFEIPIKNRDGEIIEPVHLQWETLVNFERNSEPDPNIAMLNFDKLKFPLLLRPWRNGDKFVPLGMRGSKKLSDFLTDLKLTIPQKNRTFVLESSGEICWVVGLRIDDRFKSSANQKHTFKVKLI